MDVERRKRPAPADAGPSRPTAGVGATTPSRRVRRRDVGPVPGSLPDATLGHRTGPETPSQTRIRRRTDAGAPMPEQVRTKMERAFNADFSAVRIHEGHEPTAIGAVAFTRGADIHFAPGSYQPRSARGQEILGHELAHSVQQAHGRVQATIQAKGTAVNDSAALEREADVMGGRAARGQDAFGSGASGNPAMAVRIAASGDVVQRLIHVHEVNDLYAGLKGLPKKQHAVAAREFLTRRVAEELTALLGTDYKDGTYVGKSVAIKAWVAEVEGWIAGDATTWSGETIELMRQDINQDLLYIEEQQAQDAKRQLPRLSTGHIHVGNEFTFTNKALRDLADKHGKKIKAAQEEADRTKAKKEYDVENTQVVEALIDSWDAHMRKFASARSEQPGKKVGIVRQPGKDHKGKKVRYLFPSLDWHFDVTVDPGCVEVITPPTEASKLERGEIADAIDTYIFGVATSLGLHADPLFGGGHINIDRVEGFESQTRNLATFLRAFIQDAAFWKQRDEDKYNAPFPDELGVGVDKKMLGILDKYDQLYKVKDANVAAINGRLATELIKDVFNTNIAGEDKRFSPHYQAINLEHFAEDEKAAQRVEVRRVPAQIDRATLLNELDRLFALMNRTAIPKDPRFAGRSSPTAIWSASSASGGSSKGSASSEPRPLMLGANDLAPAQGPVLTANQLVHVPILGDGNCFFNAVIRTAGLPITVADLRKELADAVKGAVDQDELEDDFPFIPADEAKNIIADLRADGSYANLAGDVAPQILTAVRPTLKLRIIQGDGRIDDVGNGAATVWLVRTSHSVDHYLATRPSG